MSKKTTPMMEQYLGVKEQHPEAIVLFRMGDFFETFFDDAKECARRLGITLTARSKEQDIPMAGVPHHAIDGYLARLVEQGCRVVLVDQVEDPKQAKGLVRRAVTRVVTPGTYLPPDAPPRLANRVAAISRGSKRELGFASLELSSGEFRCAALRSEEELVEELSRFDVKELVTPEPVDLGLRVSVSIQADPLPRRPLDRLRDHLGAEELESLRAVAGSSALDAAGRLLLYVDGTQLLPEARDLHGPATLAHVDGLIPYAPGAGVVLDAQTREHLELFSARGDAGRAFFDCIDETRTGPGSRLLASWLARPLDQLDAIRARANAVERLVEAPRLLDAMAEQARKLPDLERLVGRLALGRLHPKELRALGEALRRLDTIFGTLAEIGRAELVERGGRLVELSAIDRCADVRDHLLGVLADAPPTDPAAPGVFEEGFDRELDRLSALAFRGKEMIAELESEERERTGISSLKIRFNKVFGYYIEVTKPNLHLVPEDRFIRKQTTVNAERFYTEELKQLETDVMSAEDDRQARSRLLYEALVGKLSSEVRRLKSLSRAAAELDVLCAFATLAERRSWCRPELHDGRGFEIVEGRHPVLEELARDLSEPFVPNDLTIGARERLVIITGPNMAGKSTVMRQCALIAILAHMGAFVPARSARVGRLDRVFTRVGAGDELSRGRSTFMVEMSETARILRGATDRSLVLLDEIGRGTSTFDGLSIAWAVAEYIHDHVGCATLFATHYHELVELGATLENAGNRQIAVQEHRGKIIFSRRLEEGGASRSYGVQVARLSGLPKPVVDRARALLARLERGERLGLNSPQLDLFSAAPPEPAPGDRVLDRLRALDLDDLSPRAAHALLEELKSEL